GQLFAPVGEYLAECQRIEYTVRINRRDIPRAGTRITAYKAMTTQGEGTFGLLKTSSKFMRIVSEMMRGGNNQIQRVFSMKVRLDDPEAMGAEVIRLTGVKLWEINGGYNVNDIIEENIPFTFEGMEIEQAIEGDVTNPESRRTAYSSLD
ncbi:MAG: phage tail tube protein, partial [Nitrosopumilus sp.]